MLGNYMRIWFIVAFLFPLVAVGSLLGHTKPYTIRDAGFLDFDTKPYRLILVAKDLASPEVKARQDGIRKAIEHSNVVLISIQAEPKSVTPDLKPIKDVEQFTTPKFWLDDGVRATPFDAAWIGDLVHSKWRLALQKEAVDALGLVLLLESKDDAANKLAKTRAEKVIAKINHTKNRLDKAPSLPVRLLVLPFGEREAERWMLWGLGEDAAVADAPKIAVLYGKLRRAGANFDGTEWSEFDLFARIASLGVACEFARNRPTLLGPALPNAWTEQGGESLAKSLGFDPTDEKVRKELVGILAKPARKNADRAKTMPTLEELYGIPDPDQEHQPIPMPEIDPHAMPRLDLDAEPPGPKAPGPSIFAGRPTSVAFLALGVAGWIALGIAFYVLVRPKEPRTQ